MIRSDADTASSSEILPLALVQGGDSRGLLCADVACEPLAQAGSITATNCPSRTDQWAFFCASNAASSTVQMQSSPILFEPTPTFANELLPARPAPLVPSSSSCLETAGAMDISPHTTASGSTLKYDGTLSASGSLTSYTSAPSNPVESPRRSPHKREAITCMDESDGGLRPDTSIQCPWDSACGDVILGNRRSWRSHASKHCPSKKRVNCPFKDCSSIKNMEFDNLGRHIATIHLKNDNVCSHCGAATSRGDSHRRHTRSSKFVACEEVKARCISRKAYNRLKERMGEPQATIGKVKKRRKRKTVSVGITSFRLS